MIRSLIAGLLLCTALSNVVCAAGVNEINTCHLLTSEEIAAAIGAKVKEGERRDEGWQADGSYSSACIWMVESGSNPSPNPRARRFVILHAMQWPVGREMAGKYLQSFRKSAEQGVIRSAPTPRNFGDEALWWGDGLAVRKGDVSFGVSVFMPDAASNQPARTSVLEEKLAPLILRRIDQQSVNRAV
jgi:hypothetical protein